MYQHKMEEDIRCSLEYGLEIPVESGNHELYAFWLEKALYDTVHFERK